MLKRLGCALAVTTVTLLGFAGTAMAATFTVNDLGDAEDAQFGTPDPADGTCDTVVGGAAVCTLRAALDEANAFVGLDTVDISVPGQIDVLNGELSITETTVVNGNAGGTTLDAGGLSRVLSVFGPSVTLNDLRVQHGVVSGGLTGAGIQSGAATLTLNRVVVADNTLGSTAGDAGAGIATFSGFPLDHSLILNDSTVSGNQTTGTAGIGAGIRAAGPLTLNRSTVSGNSTTLDAGGRGGGIDMNITGGTAALTISNSTISNNHSGGNAGGSGGGGGVFTAGSVSPISIVGSTIAGNTTLGFGGGIHLNAIASSENTIYAGNTAAAGGDNCSASLSPGNNNVETGISCDFDGAGTGNQQSLSTGALSLGVLAPNGGLTATRALGAGSLAVDAGSAGCGGLTIDQRGLPRGGTAGTCDVGAFEVQDTDGDGVKDNADQCLAQVGPASNDGCPLPVSPPPTTTVPTPTATAPTPKHCKKGQKLKKGKCVKKKRKRS
jgi:hypothetical protein